jgi:hypothetical protein
VNIETISDFRAAVRHGPYAWPGGYPCYFITSDGAALSFKAAKSERRLILESIRDRSDDGWRIVALDINYEDSNLVCDHTGEKIESAYGRTNPMTYEPENLKRWTMPDHYFGEVWPNYYSAGVGQSRDSDALERSNFACMLRELGGESDTVKVVRESHSAVGWVEWIAIQQEDAKALETADQIIAALSDYPVIDESHWSELESDELYETWSGMDTRERANYIMDEVKRCHWLTPSLMRFRRLLRADYSPGSEDGLSSDEAMISRSLDESLRQA